MVRRWNSTYSGVANDALPPASRQRARCSSVSRSTARSRPAESSQTKKRSRCAAAAFLRELFSRLLERAREYRLRIDVAQHQHVGARETQRGARELAGHGVLAAGREHRPEIVRMRVGSAADEAQDAHRHAEHGELLDIKGENPDRRAALE